MATFITSARARTVMRIEPSAMVSVAPPPWKAFTAYKTAPIAVSHAAPMTVSMMNVVLNAVICDPDTEIWPLNLAISNAGKSRM